MRSALDELLSRNVRTLMSHTGLTREDLCAALGIGRSAWYDRMGSGDTKWSADAIADLRTDWVFPGRRAGSHACPNHVGEVISRLLGPQATAHSLRHRYATKAYGSSHDLLAVQQLLGHATPTTTQGYVRVQLDDLRRAAAAAS